MANHAVKRIDEMEATWLGAFKHARAELGVTSFGVQVMDIPPNTDRYPEHDHSDDGQEEVYFAVRGAGEIEIDGERYPLDPEVMVRVGPGVSRKIWPGDEPMRVLAIGATPGKVYEPPASTKLGGPDPLAQAQA
jgi:mannose-6-phosphate isomerase-like protein (cupin superfamily)